MPRTGGLSLVELLVAVAVAATLTGLAVPPFRDFVERHRSVAAINTLVGAVQLARQSAVMLRTQVIVCPRRPEGGCGSHDDWPNGALVFADRDRNAGFGSADDLLRASPPWPEGSHVRWRSFRNRPYLTFTPTGLTAWQNGHFLYCPPDGDARFARLIVLNPQGRLRQAADRDGDGVVEDAQGRPVTCG